MLFRTKSSTDERMRLFRKAWYPKSSRLKNRVEKSVIVAKSPVGMEEIDLFCRPNRLPAIQLKQERLFEQLPDGEGPLSQVL
jgi:hypothetical protein